MAKLHKYIRVKNGIIFQIGNLRKIERKNDNRRLPFLAIFRSMYKVIIGAPYIKFKHKTFPVLFKKLVFPIALMVLCFLLNSCNNKMPGSLETITALQQLQQLATVEYTVTKVVKANDNKDWYKYGDRKILFTCQAAIKAGIDLSLLKEENIHINGKNIQIKLPAPKILSVNLPPENIKVAFSKVGFFRTDFSNADRDALMTQAEKQMWASGKETGIIDQAKLNTQTFMIQWLTQLGFEEIKLSFDALKDPLLKNNPG